MTEYNATDDARKSYEAAIEAKRLRGDNYYPSKTVPLSDKEGRDAA